MITFDDLRLNAELARDVAYAALSGDPLAASVGIHKGGVNTTDMTRRTKRQTYHAALGRSFDYFEHMVNEHSNPGSRAPSIRRRIPKSSGGRRPIDEPAEYTRLAAYHVRRILLPNVEAVLHSGQLVGHHNRPETQACRVPGATVLDHTACYVHDLINKGFHYALSVDLEDAFGQVPHEHLRRELHMLGLTENAVNHVVGLASIYTWDRVSRKITRCRRQGLEQGDPLSAMLMNLSLAPLLHHVQAFTEVVIVCYVDDIYMFTRTAETARMAYHLLRGRARECGVRNVRPLVSAGESCKDAKASRIIDTRQEPITVLNSYLVAPDEVGLVPGKAHSLRREIRRQGLNTLSIRRVRKILPSRAITKRWAQRAGLVRRQLPDVHSLRPGGEKNNNLATYPGMGTGGHDDEVPDQYLPAHLATEEGGELFDSPQLTREELLPPEVTGGEAIDTETLCLAECKDIPPQAGGGGTCVPCPPSDASFPHLVERGDTLVSPDYWSGRWSQVPVVGHRLETGTCHYQRRVNHCWSPPAGAVPLTPHRVAPVEPGGEAPVRTSPPEFSSPLEDGQVVANLLAHKPLRCGAKFKGTILDLRGLGEFLKQTPNLDFSRTVGQLLKLGRGQRRVWVLVHPADGWVWNPSILGGRDDHQYRRLETQKRADGMIFSLQLRRRRQRMRNSLPAPRAEVIIHRVNVRKGRHLVRTEMVGTKVSFPATPSSPNQWIARIEAIAEVVEKNAGKSVAIRMLKGLPQLLGIGPEDQWTPCQVGLHEAVRKLRRHGPCREQDGYIISRPPANSTVTEG